MGNAAGVLIFNCCLDVRLLVCAVAERPVFSVLAIAQPVVASLLHFEANGPKMDKDRKNKTLIQQKKFKREEMSGHSKQKVSRDPMSSPSGY